MNSNFKILFFIFFHILIANNSYGKGSQCLLFYSSNGIQELTLSEILFENIDLGAEKSVKFVRRIKEGLLEIRLIGPQWGSTYNYSSEGFNNQGDPRYPLYLFGEELSRKMGIKAIKNPDGSKSLLFPNAKKIKLFLKIVNARLIEKGLDPITYLPTKFGYASAKEMIELSQRRNQNFIMHFPFEDNDANLTPHEIAYHLGQIVFPKKVLERASSVTERTLQFISLLESKRFMLGSLVDKITEKLLKERSLELDFGTANTMVQIAYLIKTSNSKKLKDLETEAVSTIYHDSIEYLSRPNYLPSFAVVERLIQFLRLPDLRKKFPNELSLSNFFEKIEIYGHDSYGSRLQPGLSSLEKKVIMQLAVEFIEFYSLKDKEKGFDVQDPKAALSELILGLAKRVDEINEAAQGVDLNKLFNSK